MDQDLIIVPVRQFREHLADYLRAVSDGQSIIITKHGRAIAELRPSSIGSPSLTI